MEKYRPTENQIVEAKNGSNELFQFDVPDYLQPNNLRHTQNLSGFTGIWHGIYYHYGVPQVSKEERNI